MIFIKKHILLTMLACSLVSITNAMDAFQQTILDITANENIEHQTQTTIAEQEPIFVPFAHTAQKIQKASQELYEALKNPSAPEMQIFINMLFNAYSLCKDDLNDVLYRIAATGKNIWLMQIIVHAGADVNCQDRVGCTPIHLAIVNGNLNVVKVLILLGADVNLKAIHGETPLDTALQLGKMPIASLLRKSGAREL